jgi:twinfilin-like protein
MIDVDAMDVTHDRDIPASGTLDEDLDSIAGTVLDAKTPRYLLVRDDDGEWLFFAFVPDTAGIKSKMLYAATRATVKKQLGSNFFKMEMFGTETADFTSKGYRAFVEMKEGGDPLTIAELEKKEIVEMGEIYEGGQSSYVHGVAFPLAPGVKESIDALSKGNAQYVGLGLDIPGELVTHEETSNDYVGLEGLAARVPSDVPRFHFVRLNTNDEIIFVYTCPDGLKIKERMLYSSSKQGVMSLLPSASIKRSFEFSSADDIDPQDMETTLHPPVETGPKVYAKPKRAGAGGRRLIRTAK